jgi:hypothetical protein
MTAFDYARAAATADRLIERYGQVAILRRQGTPHGPPQRPQVSITFYQIRCVRLDLKVNPFKQVDPAASWSVKAGQERLLVRVLEGVEPQIGDQIMVDNVATFVANQNENNFKRKYTVEFPSILKPGGVNVLFDLVVMS